MAYKVYKYRIYPNKGQCELLEKHFGCTRFLYNQYVDWMSKEYEKWKADNTHKTGSTPLVTVFKAEFDFLKEVDNASLAYARSNFEKARNDFYKSLKGGRKGKKLGAPKYKKKGVSRFSYRTCDSHGGIRFDGEGKKFRLPKIGWVSIVRHRDCEGVIKAVTVSRTKTYKYYVSVTVECDDRPLPLKLDYTDKPKVVGLDMSLPSFCVSSDENDDAITKYQHPYRKEEAKLRKLGRRLSRKKKGSRNREKARRNLAALHERISNRRQDFCVKTALYFARKYDAVVIEGLDMQSMSRTLKLGKSVMDLGWGIFRQWLTVECQKHGTRLVIADKWFASSKTCSCCGYKNGLLTLSDRSWVCPECGTVHDRDRNAAVNLRDSFLNELVPQELREFTPVERTASGREEKPSRSSRLDEAGSPSL